VNSNKTVLSPGSHPLIFLCLLFSVIPPENEEEAPTGVYPTVPSPTMQKQHAQLPLENPQ